MKKKLTVLVSTALFAFGLAFYANYSNTVNVLSDSNVEALSSGDDNGGGGNPYIEFGSSPNRVIADMQTHVIVIENMRQAYDSKGRPMNGCIQEVGSACVIDTTTTVYNLGQITSFLESFFNALSVAVPFFQFIIGLFK